MKIGIMSMQRIINYGSFLQAYGLKSLIKSIGYNDVEFVDFKTNPQVNIMRRFSLIDLFYKGERFIQHRLTSKKRMLYKKAKFFDENFASHFPTLGLEKDFNYSTNVDLLIIGSDEVFNCFQSQGDEILSYDLFGKDCKAPNIISYAASFGSTKYERMVSAGVDKEIGDLLEKFMAVSVRDSNSYSNAELLTGRNDIEMHLDPVLMYEFENEIIEPIVSEPYIIVYAYRGRITTQEGKKIREFARKKKMKLYCIGGVQDFCDDFIIASPFEVLGWMKNASYIITDTFHGTIFSIKYGVKFASIIRDNNREKLYDLLCKFNLTDREVHNINNLENIVEKEFDANKANEIIKKERIRTKEYLTKYIDKSCQ